MTRLGQLETILDYILVQYNKLYTSLIKQQQAYLFILELWNTASKRKDSVKERKGEREMGENRNRESR